MFDPKRRKAGLILAASLGLAASPIALTGCEQDDVDDVYDDTTDAVEDTADDVSDELEDAADDIDDP